MDEIPDSSDKIRYAAELLLNATRRSVEHCTQHAMAPGYISLAYLIDFRMIKLYLLPMLANMEVVLQ